MSAHMRKHHTNTEHIRMTYHSNVYEVPLRVLEKYRIVKSPSKKEASDTINAEDFFSNVDEKYSKAGALLKGLRYREDLNQTEFAKRINVTQADLSKMENGKRRIGRTLAQRIAKEFGINYRSLLE